MREVHYRPDSSMADDLVSVSRCTGNALGNCVPSLKRYRYSLPKSWQWKLAVDG